MKFFSLFIGFSLFFSYQFLSQADVPDQLSRGLPRPIVFVPHDRSKSDPQQVHVSLAGKDNIRVTYITEDKKVDSVVEYGRQSGKYDQKTTGESTSYKYIFYSSGKIHHVKIGPLQPNTTYYYRCGGNGPEFSFKTPPLAFPVEFAIVGDLGQTEWTAATLSQIKSQDYDVFLLPGDLSYADTSQPLWDSFGRLVEPLASQRPWMVTQGNHEVEFFPILEHTTFKSYNARWLMPYSESLSDSNLYYSFDVAGVHTIMLGSYTDFDCDSDQYQWLQADLAKIDRKKTPWVVVLLHAPWYNTNEAHEGEGESMRDAMESLLFSARVDVVFSGHVHAYERFKRVYNNKADPCGPIYITIGDGGNREGLAKTFKKPPSPLSVFREPSFGHGRLKVIDGKTAHWSWHRNNDSNSLLADEFWLESLSTSSLCWPPSRSSDLGQTEWTAATLSQIKSQDYDVFLLPGDLSYADTSQPLWDSFGRLVEPLASQRPWMVTQGNHEVEFFPILEHTTFKSYNARWLMPYSESLSDSNLYYSFDVAGVHTIMLGSYTDFDCDSDQYQWLQADLAKIDRKKTSWVVVLLHAPWYNANEAHEGEGESMRDAMESLLFSARVDVVFSGHVHAYERFKRVYNNKADPCGPIYITIGDGGNREGLAKTFKKPPSPLSVFREPSFGHGRLKVIDGKTAHWSWHRNNDSNSLLADEFWLESLSTSSLCWPPSRSSN